MPKGTGVQERIARINAKQAILVAIIGVAGVVSGALIQSYKSTGVSPKQVWLVVKDAKTFVQYLDKTNPATYAIHARLVVHVNGTALSYPSRAVWATVGQGPIAEEAIPLPTGADEYRISFEVYYRTSLDFPDTVRQALSQEVDVVKQVPYQGEYTVHRVISGAREPPMFMSIKYEVRDDL